jgi:diguanylate cyclase (GGDEF)-like protein
MAGKGSGYMALKISEVFEEYPNPFFIIRPIIINGESEDFEYIYANKAFCIFLGLSQAELVGHRYREVFKKDGERVWLDLFTDAAIGRKHMYMENVSSIISIQMYTEVFHIEPDLCGCIIHDFKSAAGNKAVAKTKTMRRRPDCDFLTGFYNRFYLQEIYDELSTIENIGIAFLDINDLKLTNDTVGHAAGDALILQVSALLKAYYTDSMIFRIGGDEFVIITQGQTREAFMEISNKLKQEFEEKALAAIGFNYYEKPDTLQTCIEECDSMMYDEKKRMKQVKR